MVDIISTDDLAAYLDPLTVEGSRADLIVHLTNGLIAEKWDEPVDPPPTSVLLLALTVAERAFTRSPGQGLRESVTVAFDDSSRTERFAVPSGVAERAGVYLTDDELALLNGDAVADTAVGSISLSVPGASRQRTWDAEPGWRSW